MSDVLDDLRERHEYTKTAWHDIRAEAAIDMQYVNGDPWDEDDKKQRAGRPTIAPEEMGQYFNQVINNLWSNPRGIKYAPRGNGASDATARFYMDKVREIEYRSHAKIAYITAASDAIQRSYGYLRVTARYASPRSANQELWIEAVPDPDMVSPDPDAKMPDSSDMQFCFVEELRDQAEFKRTFKSAKVRDFGGDHASKATSWLVGNKIRVAEYWTISTRPRQLLLVQPPSAQALQPQRLVAPSPQPMPPPIEVFSDEMPPGATVIRELRTVEYPTVKMYLTNGVEILHEQDWPGKYIPIISCYGKVLYVPKAGESKRVLLSMTRFGRAAWKAMCYSDSSMIEAASGVVKAAFMVPKGTFAGRLGELVQESMYSPKAYVEYDDQPDGSGQKNPPPVRPDFPAAQHIQSMIQMSEHYRQRVQSAMGSNFLPTDAQRINQKSKVALDKIEQSASTGTFHFVNNYEDTIRQTGVIVEDLIDKYYDFAGETTVMEADHTAKQIAINTGDPEAVSTKGDHLTTVSTGPSSDSERDAANEFLETTAGNIEALAAIAGREQAAKIFALAVKERLRSPMGDQIADMISPPPPIGPDGKPLSPEMQAMQAQLRQAMQENQQLKMAIETKTATVHAQNQGKLAVAQLEAQATSADKAADREVKLVVAELGAKVDRMALLLEASNKIGVRLDGQRDVAHAAAEGAKDRVHEDIQNVKDRAHEHIQGALEHQRATDLAALAHRQALEAGAQGVAGQLAVGQQAADNAPQPQAGA